MKYLIVLVGVFIVSCTDTPEDVNHEENNSTDDHVQLNEVVEVQNSVNDSYSVKTTFSPEHGWGYQILNNGTLYINQPHMPSVPGNDGFDSEDKAKTTADFIIYKLDNGIFPPTVSPEELDSLGVM